MRSWIPDSRFYIREQPYLYSIYKRYEDILKVNSEARTQTRGADLSLFTLPALTLSQPSLVLSINLFKQIGSSDRDLRSRYLRTIDTEDDGFGERRRTRANVQRSFGTSDKPWLAMHVNGLLTTSTRPNI